MKGFQNKNLGQRPIDLWSKQKQNQNSSLIKLLLLIIPVAFLILFIGSIFIYLSYVLYVQAQIVPPAPFVLPQFSEYPKLTQTVHPEISAQAAIVIENSSKVILYEKNPALRFSPASTTKIMTALVGLDSYALDKQLQITYIDPESVHVGFVAGEKVTFGNLLYAMLLPSSNDAATAIAENYPEGREKFIDKMNEKAKSFHLYNTHFADPVGLADDETYTTVEDLSRLSAIAMENTLIASIVGTKEKTIEDVSGKQFTVKNINQLLGINGVNGIKTGFTEGAKEVLATSDVWQGHTFIIIVMKSDDRFADTQTLINQVVDNTTFESIHL